jgi:hypothetical protein
MFKAKILAMTILIGLSSVSASAQSFQQLVNQCFQGNNVDACMEMENQIRGVGSNVVPMQPPSAAETDLSRRCYSGDSRACQVATEHRRGQIRQMDQQIQMLDLLGR